MVNWEKQLDSMVKDNHLDQINIDDFGIAYAAETGDGSMIGVGGLPFLVPVFLPWIHYIISGMRVAISMSRMGSNFHSLSCTRWGISAASASSYRRGSTSNDRPRSYWVDRNGGER